MSTQKHDSGVRRSELGLPGERIVVEGKFGRKCYECGGVGHFKWECPREVKPRFVGEKPQEVENPTRVVRCYSHGENGYILTRCQAQPNLYCRLDSVESGLRCKGRVADVQVSCIYFDTGCSQTLVRWELIPKGNVLTESVELKCVHGDVERYPLVFVEDVVEGRRLKINAEVAGKLPVDV